MPTSAKGQSDHGGQQAEGEEGSYAKSGGSAPDAAPTVRAEPEGVTGKADGEVGDAHESAKVMPAAAIVHVPEFGLPGARPVFAFRGGNKSRCGAKESAVEGRQRGRRHLAHERFSATRCARSGYLSVAASAAAFPSRVTS